MKWDTDIVILKVLCDFPSPREKKLPYSKNQEAEIFSLFKEKKNHTYNPSTRRGVWKVPECTRLNSLPVAATRQRSAAPGAPRASLQYSSAPGSAQTSPPLWKGGRGLKKNKTTRLPPRINRVRFPTWSPPDFHVWESCWTMPLVSGFSRDLPFPPPLHSGAAPHSPRFNLIGSQDLDVKSHHNLFTYSPPTSRGAVGWCAVDLWCGRLWIRIPCKTWVSCMLSKYAVDSLIRIFCGQRNLSLGAGLDLAPPAYWQYSTRWKTLGTINFPVKNLLVDDLSPHVRSQKRACGHVFTFPGACHHGMLMDEVYPTHSYASFSNWILPVRRSAPIRHFVRLASTVLISELPLVRAHFMTAE
ncbi:hypothetical protein PR048_003602 [Dryococelus australis]|uniref:Uncharacterized protein n=1 Tax=Dryococelus australis TaxID=614101 RepID=A0ABQ9INJ1_9NEOP|nr:hypothetical protein PR048_003602 [Dryococelus australis]